MRQFAYAFRYWDRPPAKDAPFRKSLSPTEIEDVLDRFEYDLRHSLRDLTARVDIEQGPTPQERRATITTTDSAEDVRDTVRRVLSALDLVGDELTA